MRSLRMFAVVVAGVLLLTLSVGSVGAVGGRPFTTQLLGANEVPITGDPDATGTAHIWVNQGQGSVCWSIEVANVDDIFAAHIHLAPAGVPGPVVVPLNPYTGGCTTVSKELAHAIITNPEAYYVNVHNPTYPGGAARGQLSDQP
jgi:CHRD domain